MKVPSVLPDCENKSPLDALEDYFNSKDVAGAGGACLTSAQRFPECLWPTGPILLGRTGHFPLPGRTGHSPLSGLS
jgi:hypothetical protein